MPRDYQPSFTGGEIAPALHARSDLARYHSSLAKCYNWFAHAQGGISTRAGFRFVYQHPAQKIMRMIPFEFNTDQVYMLAFSDLEMRVILKNPGQDPGVVLEDPSFVVSAMVSASGNTTITATGHPFINGNEIYIAGTNTNLDNRLFIIHSVAGNDFQVSDELDAAYVSGGTAARVFVLTTPYLEAHLFDLNFTQSADVMTMVHPEYVIREISRTAHDAWSIATVTFASGIAPPSNVTPASVGSETTPTSDAQTFRYVVTSVAEGGDESVASSIVRTRFSTTRTDTLGTALTWTAVAQAEYYNVYKEVSANSETFGFIGESEASGRSYTITNITASATPTITLSTNPVFSEHELIRITGITGDPIYQQFNNKFWVVEPNSTGTTFTMRTSVSTSGAPAFAGGGTVTVEPQFADFMLGPDSSITPPIDNDPFDAVDKYPRAVTYHQQRLSFGGSKILPQTFWMTRTADYNNMDYSRPRRADDSITIGIASSQVNEIRHVLSMEDFMVMTSGGVWAIKSDDTGVLKPSNVRAVRQGSRGCSSVRPLIVGGTALFIQSGEARVRDLRYTFDVDKFTSSDLSIMAEHLFYGHTITDWCYAEEPYSIIWAVREDGVMLALTYIRDQQVWGWSQHETDGDFVSVSSIREGQEDAVYATVKRGTEYSVERLNERRFTNVRDAFCVDSGLTYQGDTHSITAIDKSSACRVTSAGHGILVGTYIFIRGVVGMTEVNDRQYKVANITTNSFTLQDEDGRDISSSVFKEYTSGGTIEVCTPTLSGLEHLNGKTCVALADGNVIESLVPADGKLTLEPQVHKIHIGLGYNCDFETLPIDFQQETAQSRKKAISRLAMRVEKTRGLSGGKDADTLYEIKDRTASDEYGDLEYFTGIRYLDMNIPWTDDGQIYVRQSYPLPGTVLGIVPEVVVVG
jgi:hypothetical protein